MLPHVASDRLAEDVARSGEILLTNSFFNNLTRDPPMDMKPCSIEIAGATIKHFKVTWDGEKARIWLVVQLRMALRRKTS